MDNRNNEYKELKKIRLHEIKELFMSALKLIQEYRQNFDVSDENLQKISSLIKELFPESKTTKCQK